jgi:integrase
VTKRKETGNWRARYWDAEGKQHSRTFALKGHAETWLRTELDALHSGKPKQSESVAGEGITFGAHAEAWLAAKAKGDVRPNTLSLYRLHYRNHIAPTFADRPLDAVTKAEVKAWWAALLVKPKNGNPKNGSLSRATCAKVYRLLRQLFGAAVEDDLLGANPCQIRGAAQEPDYSLAYDEPPDADEVRAFAAAVGDRYSAMVLLAGFGGLRWGEVVGLQRRHIDLTKGTVRVVQQIVRQGGSAIDVGETKTSAGRRTVWLHPEAVDALRVHLATHVASGPTAYLFTAPEGGLVRNQNWRKRVWLPATVAVGREGRRFHDLRHAAATFAALTGASTKDLMARMGHKSQAAAIRYQHATQSEQAAIAERLAALLATPATKPDLRLVEGDG